ncbi:TPA: tRNA (adenosine(37)-N6)-threonylcarbamoyltransferase complex ATPase subunit type 1 TsaE [Elizabethkingia anophelis]|nr:tRNA (adenosine(37)-N6)-threonylcarbamoyltransferase complex ATPase subunit type 1 TsaE [Elizabethkingia anophelis]HBN6704460.1 tRNA (adenosine(37)-N6)-threonylcarbamoyltransferase complex ATPase subunit type 1 TsaE [Elizabethkingia anophelis]HBN6707134.1 tRNA (adenosine(37)-N6)-threonylcarbamoyltransferase complex ATPase subunit type 1 TsaE [Elizabethkingia anophelis]HBN6708450.1 tRNA (adenosine(37)-N6)-threonylcarbamoyltransferase complex ATPase subunit type 1 TsaE [Elizabethkingia anopheli
MLEIEISSIEQWQEVAEKIKQLLKHNILFLKGNLGAGKTTFTQKLVKSLGSNDEVTSPTYSIVNEYESPEGKIFHFDLYRLRNLEEVYDIGIEDYLDNAFLSIIEWPEIFQDEISDLPHHEMEITNSDNIRTIKFK